MKKYLDKDWLYQKYIVEGLSTVKIAKLCNMNTGTIWYFLHKFGFGTRSRSEAITGSRHPMQGKHLPSEHKIKISQSLMGIVHSEECRKKLSIALKGKKQRLGQKNSPEHRRKISEALSGRPYPRGENSYHWKGGITKKEKLIRGLIEYRLWREAVFARDNWTCQGCKVRGGKLNAHHIKPFSKFPELRLAIDNGITFCMKCHRKVRS